MKDVLSKGNKKEYFDRNGCLCVYLWRILRKVSGRVFITRTKTFAEFSYDIFTAWARDVNNHSCFLSFYYFFFFYLLFFCEIISEQLTYG